YLHDKRLRRRYLHRAIDRFLLRWTDEVICVANSDKDLALREKLALPDHVSVIYNGIDLAQFDRRTGQRNDHFIVGSVGRLHEHKGHIYLLQAASVIHQAYSLVIFWIIGVGKLLELLQT